MASESANPEPGLVPMVPSKLQDPLLSATPTVNLPLSQLPLPSPTKSPNSCLTRSHSLPMKMQGVSTTMFPHPVNPPATTATNLTKSI